MRSPFLYAKNIFIIMGQKIKHGSRIRFGSPIQTFSRLCTEIHGKGTIKIGRFDQNRGTLYLVADGGTIEIGDHCFFNTGSCITAVESVRIGNNCKFGNNLVVVDHDHNFKNEGDKEFISTPVEIGDNVWVGANVTILRGTKIGNNCVIGAGSVVKGEISAGKKVIQKRSAL